MSDANCRPETRARRGLVASPHALASDAGLQILRRGGNALDAAIAAAATVAVVYPHMNGLGGDNVWLIYDARQQRLRALCAVGRAARAASLDWYAARGITSAIPARGGRRHARERPGAGGDAPDARGRRRADGAGRRLRLVGGPPLQPR